MAPLEAAPRETISADGKPFEAELVAVDAQWRVTLREDGRERELSADDLVRWGSCVEPTRGPVVVTADGGLLVADVFAADREKLSADTGLFGPIDIPRELVAAVIFRLPPERHARDRLLDLVRSDKGRDDHVILINGDRIAGRFQGISENSLDVEAGVGPLSIETHRVRAIVFDPSRLSRPPRPGLHAVAGFADGTRLSVGRLVVGDGSLEVTVGDRRRRAPAEALVGLQLFGPRVTYLSDLEDSGYRPLPFLDLAWPYHKDRNVLGGQLRCDGQLYLKGLGMHSTARLTYLLTEPYQRFETRLGIDDHAGGRGSVRFRVYVDGQAKYTSPIVRGGSKPIHVAVGLDEAKRLDLIVDYADRADELDHADWLEARLMR